MDIDQIKSQRIVERYLSGDLLMREAREFEVFCREHPDALDGLPIPARIKAQLRNTREFDGMGTSVVSIAPSEVSNIAAVSGLKVIKANEPAETDEDDDDDLPRGGVFNKVLGVLLIAALLGVGGLLWKVETQQTELRKLSVAAKSLKLRAATDIRTLKLTPTDTQVNDPQAAVSLTQAEWLDFYVDVSTSRYNAFAVTLEKADENVRLIQIKRMTPDSNKQLRISINSGTLNVGQYELKLDGLDYHGDPHPDGYVLIAAQ